MEREGKRKSVRRRWEGRAGTDVRWMAIEQDKESSLPTSEEEAEEEMKIQPWLPRLLSSTFFDECQEHPGLKKNERTFFCLTCGGEAMCQHCLSDHYDHTVLQIRRYVYHNVVKVQDLHRHLEPSGVQTYVINASRVIFLDQRPQNKPGSGKAGAGKSQCQCKFCSRPLRDGFSFCSLACKVAISKNGRFNLLPRQGDDGLSSPESSADSPVAKRLKNLHSTNQSSSKLQSSKLGRYLHERNHKNRRKGTPSRSPMV